MGTHVSPCGRFLVACVACVLPHSYGGHGSQLHEHYDSTGAGTSPTRQAFPSRQIIYELRVYSLEDATFGTVLATRAIKAAHCLTSIQFSPTSEHILLAYGRQHSSLLRTILINGETRVPVYTVLEVYRVSDMELVRVLPSVGEEVNVACFHPSPGSGLVYGTKQGKVRFLRHHGASFTCWGERSWDLEACATNAVLDIITEFEHRILVLLNLILIMASATSWKRNLWSTEIISKTERANRKHQISASNYSWLTFHSLQNHCAGKEGYYFRSG